MSYKIAEIEGIGKTYRAKLAKIGIVTTAGLLKSSCDRKGRRRASKSSGLSEKQLLKWANMADLMRISGIGKQYAEILENAGVDTVKELRRRNASSLAAKAQEVNAKKKLARVAPSEKRISGWIEQAKALKPLISH